SGRYVSLLFGFGQSLFVHVEVYYAGVLDNPPQHRRVASGAESLAVVDGTHKVIDTPQVRVNRLDSKRDNVLPVKLTIPFDDLKPGQYTCQVNVIDELGRKFSFPRTLLIVMAAGERRVPTSPQ